jgi:hypothetical protein
MEKTKDSDLAILVRPSAARHSYHDFARQSVASGRESCCGAEGKDRNGEAEAACRKEAIRFLCYFFSNDLNRVWESEAERALDFLFGILWGSDDLDVSLRNGFQNWKNL